MFCYILWRSSGLHPSASVEVAHGDDLGIIPPDDAAEPGRNLSLESISNEESLAAASNTNAFIKQLLEMPGVDVDGRRLLVWNVSITGTNSTVVCHVS